MSFDINTVIVTVGTITASIAGAWVAVRYAKKGQEETARVDASGNQLTAETQFREQILRRVTDLERRLDDSNRAREVDRMRYEDVIAAAALKFDAREEQLVTWGTWDDKSPPRRPPAFVWPPGVAS